jgi:hypothetical protein
VLFEPAGLDAAVLASSGTRLAQETGLETFSNRISASTKEDAGSSTPRHRQTPFHRRLPGFARAKRSHRRPIAVQHRDLDLVQIVSSFVCADNGPQCG